MACVEHRLRPGTPATSPPVARAAHLRGMTSPPSASLGVAGARPGRRSRCRQRSQVPTASSSAAGASPASGAALRQATCARRRRPVRAGRGAACLARAAAEGAQTCGACTLPGAASRRMLLPLAHAQQALRQPRRSTSPPGRHLPHAFGAGGRARPAGRPRGRAPRRPARRARPPAARRRPPPGTPGVLRPPPPPPARPRPAWSAAVLQCQAGQGALDRPATKRGLKQARPARAGQGAGRRASHSCTAWHRRGRRGEPERA